MHFDDPAYFHLTVKPLTTRDMLTNINIIEREEQ